MRLPAVLIVDPGCFTPSYDRSLALGLDRAGWEVELISSESEFEPLEPVPGVTTRLLFPAGMRPGRRRGSRFRRRLERAAGLPLGMFRLDRLVARRPPGILHVQWSHLPILDRLLWRRWRKAGWRVVYTAHDVRPLPGTTPGIFAGGYRRLAACADAVVVHSQAARAELFEMGVGAQRLHVIPIALALEDETKPDRLPARGRLGIAPEAPAVLFFGFVKPYKGLEVLLASLPSLRAAQPDLRVIVAGEIVGSRAAYLRLAQRLGVSEALLWRPGFVPSREVADLFAAADVVALPYLAASSSAVLLTAYGFRRPVVATAVGGLSELVDPGVTGLLVPAGDPIALAEALSAVLADRELAAEMGERGHARLKSHHNWDGVVQRLDSVYRGLER